MQDKSEWEKLVRDVERAQVDESKRTTPFGKAAPAGPAANPRTAVPNVIPLYMQKHAAVQQETVESASNGKKLLIFASLLAVVLIGGYYLFKSSPQPEPQPEVTNAVVVPARNQLASGGNWGAGGSGGAAAWRVAMQHSLRKRIRPNNFFDVLGGGQIIELKKVSSLELPKNGSPLTVYVVMYARPSEALESQWRNAGLFANEIGRANPFFRKVTVANPEQLDLLLDWHVEGVLTALPKNMPKSF